MEEPLFSKQTVLLRCGLLHQQHTPMITQSFNQTPLITRTRRAIARLAHSRPVSNFINFPPVARTVQRLTYANTVPQHARQSPRTVQPARHTGASLQSRLDEIARDINRRRQELDVLAQALIEQGFAAWESSDTDARLIVRGRAKLLGVVGAVLVRVRVLFVVLVR